MKLSRLTFLPFTCEPEFIPPPHYEIDHNGHQMAEKDGDYCFLVGFDYTSSSISYKKLDAYKDKWL